MRKILFCLLLIPVLGIGQKNVINATRVFPKVDKVLEFEKALAAHAQKYHKGDWAWRVFEIQSGPDQGGYHLTEGPATWESIDTRSNLGDIHNTDWNKSVAIYLTDRSSSGYYEYEDSLSTIGLTDWADKIVINHIMAKPGMVAGVTDLVKRLRKVWMAGNEKVAVYQDVASGSPETTTVTRLKNGFKELATGYRDPLSTRFESVYGSGTWNQFLQDYSKVVESRWSEILSYRKDLSSK